MPSCSRSTAIGCSRTWAAPTARYVNGIRVDNTYTLKLGDQIRVGRSLLVFGAQPGVIAHRSGNVSLAGDEAGMDSAIMHTVPSNDDSMVLAVPEPAAAAMANLKILYQLGAALGSSFDVDQVLEVVMDLVFEHVKADRGIILLLDRKPASRSPRSSARATRKPKRSDRQSRSSGETAARFQASRTIINHVLNHRRRRALQQRDGRPALQQGQERSQPGHSLGLVRADQSRASSTRKGGDEIIGVIYIDSSVKNYTYSPDQLRLLTAIGLQAGMAIQNAKLYRQGLQAERLAAIGETTAALSHSIKNILQALRGGADVVEMGLNGNNIAQASKGWRIVDRNLEKIYNLTMNLLAYSKPREPKLELINPESLDRRMPGADRPAGQREGRDGRRRRR